MALAVLPPFEVPAEKNNRLVTLLAGVYASAAQAVKLNPAFLVDEKALFELFLFTYAGHDTDLP